MIRVRSTNERALARHHAFLKRRPSILAPSRNDDDDDDDDTDTDDDDPDPRGGVAGGRKGDTIHTTLLRPTPPIIPPVPNPQPTVRPTVATTVITRPAPTTIVPNVLSTPITSATLASTPSVSTSLVSSTPTTSARVLTTSTPTTPQTGDLGIVASSGTQAPESSGTGTPSSAKSQGVSPGAIGATVAVLVLVALGIIAFFVRKHHQRRRAKRRNTWGAGLVPSLETKRQSAAVSGQSQFDRPMSPYGGIAEHERLANVPPTAQMSQTPAPYAFGPPSRASGTPAPNAYAAYGPGLNQPSSAYNPSLSPPPISPFVAPSVPAASLRSVTPSMSPMNAMHAAPAVEHAVVTRTFVPSLPDELHISNGEQIRVLSAYDDGWALCANSQGEQGVVPLECLQRSGGAPVEMQLQPDSGIGAESNRTSRRISSLVAHAPGTY